MLFRSFTNALVDGNYAAIPQTGTLTNSTETIHAYSPTTTGFSLQSLNPSWGTQDSYWVTFAVFR